MEKRKAIEATDSKAVANPDNASAQSQPKIDLPAVESPSISPTEIIDSTKSDGDTTPAQSTDTTTAPSEILTAGTETNETAAGSQNSVPKRSRFALRPRYKRYAVLAASVTIASALGGIVGAATSAGSSKPAVVDITAVEENKAMQQSIARLTKEIASLKASLETANKSASSQFAKISERLNREITTASVTPSQTGQSAPQVSAPLPSPRPGAAAADTQASPRPTILTDWSIRETRDGFVYVQGHGDIYQVVPGAPLPGLGPVEQIKRQDGRWLVVTPKGIIVSMRDRRYFEQF